MRTNGYVYSFEALGWDGFEESEQACSRKYPGTLAGHTVSEEGPAEDPHTMGAKRTADESQVALKDCGVRIAGLTKDTVTPSVTTKARNTIRRTDNVPEAVLQRLFIKPTDQKLKSIKFVIHPLCKIVDVKSLTGQVTSMWKTSLDNQEIIAPYLMTVWKETEQDVYDEPNIEKRQQTSGQSRQPYRFMVHIVEQLTTADVSDERTKKKARLKMSEEPVTKLQL